MEGTGEGPIRQSSLLVALEDSRWYVRQAAARALERIGDRRAVLRLELASKDPRPAVARAARKALEHIAETSLQPLFL